MKFDYYKKLGRKLTMVCVIGLTSISIAYQSDAIAARGGNNGDHGGGPGNARGQGAGNSLGDRINLVKAENASDTARIHAAHVSAVMRAADPDHYLDGHDHNTD